MRDYAGLITAEHADKPKYTAMVAAVAGSFGSNADVIASMPSLFDIDNAEGAQLDIVGLWVGQSRLIPNVLLVQFFGFEDNPASLPYGEEGQPSVGGRLYGEGEPYTGTTILADPEYRTVLKAKIVRNHSKGTTADIVRALDYMFGAPGIVHDPGTMAISVAIGRPLTLVERAMVKEMDILPRPAGVRINDVGYFDYGSYLGFDGQPSAQPFAEESVFTLDGSWPLDGSVTLDGAPSSDVKQIYLLEEF